ncbi:ABC transporter ATP-binding protein [Stygiolobus caldivivus]|uniref:ABC transporter ATP-binding protein n=1 Tax=Stygiolobus caldivivus TaxID=2824673 RepID=A0A8D5U7N9_9CREN|nr:ABC transporter ATP-binding protein [Stygiolobus caldivivus]BCU70848.1 ABC transporter ATP-binding protein [Stygiolobus caldivivus]
MNLIELKGVEVTYTGRAKPSLTVEQFNVKEGESVLIVGKSGSGKSTLVSVINGVIPNMITAQVKGEINVFGKDPRKTPIFEIAKNIGTVLQDPEMQVFNHKVVDEIAFGPENLMLPPEEIMNRVTESSKVAGVYELLERETQTLSGGELQRTVLASVLAMGPRALILDEPTSNIDPEGTAQIFSLIKRFRQEKRTLLIVEHKLERVLPYVDRVVLIDKGKLVFDIGKDELVDKADILSEAGVEVPDYYFHMKKHKSVQKYVYSPPPRVKGDSVVLDSSVKVWERKTGKVLVDTSLTLRRGEITALMGRNGAGKSTLLKAIMGLLDKKLASEIRLVVEGKDISKASIMERGAYIGYLPQNFDVMFIKRTVEDEVAFAMKNRGIYNRDTLNEILKMFSLYEIRREDPLMLSMGQRRRVAMASVIASGAKILLMDEPTSGQDWYHREMLGKEVIHLRDKGFSFLIVTHDSRFVDKFCDRVLVMDKGKIVAEGVPEEVFFKEGLGIHPPTEYLVMKYGTLEFSI